MKPLKLQAEKNGVQSMDLQIGRKRDMVMAGGITMPTTQMIPEWRAAADEIWAVLNRTAQIQEEIDKLVKETAQEMKVRGAEIDQRFQETDKLVKENAEEMKVRSAEIDRRFQETDRRFQETDRRFQETDKIIKENAKAISELGRRFGESVEYMVAPNLAERFKEMNYEFTRAFQNKYIKDSRDAVLAEVDTFLENSANVAAVETKVKPSIEDVKDHVKRMEKLRVYADAHNDKRKYLGAIAGMVVKQNVKDFALKNGFFVLEPSGSTFSITAPPDSPREW
jgi:hypothetical protein